MDPFSHGILGATVASLFRKNKEKLSVAILCGITAAMAPDLDIFIKSSTDTLLGLQFHRHFTHALAFVPFGAVLIAFLWWLIFKKKHAFIELWIYCMVGMASHGFLDSLTNYGTHLFWPFTDRRESWNIISIIDPIFTLTLLGLLITCFVKKSRRYTAIGFIFALLYWSAGYIQKERVTQATMATAALRNHVIEKVEVKPSFANIALWRSHYRYNGFFYIDGYHITADGKAKLYEGGKVAIFQPLDIPPSSRLQKDIERFSFFSDDWLAPLPNDQNMIADMRFGLLPTDTHPLWGIKINPNNPEEGAVFTNLRKRREGDVAELWQMIQGK